MPGLGAERSPMPRAEPAGGREQGLPGPRAAGKGQRSLRARGSAAYEGRAGTLPAPVPPLPSQPSSCPLPTGTAASVREVLGVARHPQGDCWVRLVWRALGAG